MRDPKMSRAVSCRYTVRALSEAGGSSGPAEGVHVTYPLVEYLDPLALGAKATAGPGLAIIHSSLILLKSVTIARKLADEFFHLIRHDRSRFLSTSFRYSF